MYTKCFKLANKESFTLITDNKLPDDFKYENIVSYIKGTFNPDDSVEVYDILQVFKLDVVYVNWHTDYKGDIGFTYTFILSVRKHLCLDSESRSVYGNRVLSLFLEQGEYTGLSHLNFDSSNSMLTISISF